jgi:alpha-galactosidase
MKHLHEIHFANKILRFLLIVLFIGIIPLPQIQAQNANIQPFTIESGRLKLNFVFLQHMNLRLQSILPENYEEKNSFSELNSEAENEVFIQVTGENRGVHHGAKLTGGNPGMRLEFIEKTETNTVNGKLVILVQKDPVKNLKVESYYEFYNGIPVIRRFTRVVNEGRQVVGIEYLSSAVLNNYGNITSGSPQDNLLIHYAFNSWQQEAQWKTSTLSELGWDNNGSFNINSISFDNIGSWSTIKYLPIGMIENTKAGITWFWQIEHNGSWHCEMSNTSNGSTYLYLGGPDAEHSQAWKNLKPGEAYQTVPVALGCVTGGFDKAVVALTQYRRLALLRPHPANQSCPVVFNDYMNCLFGDPTTEKELPLIKKAAKAGCNYFVIDAGWYADKNETWWDAVGLWEPSLTRFAPNGLQSLLDTIRKYGMKPGLWLEPEVAGIKSPLKEKPDNWFLLRSGSRIIDNSRFLLDFRNPEVRAYMSSVVRRMVDDYGIGYIKMDYNNTVWGTDSESGSAGQGLLDHNRAVVGWYKEIADRYPGLIIENCGSGGCRMDYAMLSQTNIQSSTDQTDYRKYPAIIVGAMAAVVPEQLAAWSYPRKNCDSREASFNMVSAMMCRIHQSGNITDLSSESFDMIQEGIAIYKSQLVPFIPLSVPFFPLGMPSLQDTISPVAVGLRDGNKEYLAVWRLLGNASVETSLPPFSEVKLVYPTDMGIKVSKNGSAVKIDFPAQYMAAIVEIISH